jgi:hypothetical protein
MEFKKLSAVEMAEAVSDTASVLIEEDGVVKRAPKNEIGAQADWAETDPNSPAFVKNKPVEEYDLDLTIDIPWDVDANSQGAPVCTAADGYSYNTIAAKFESKEIPNIRITINADNNGTLVHELTKPTAISILNGAHACMWFSAITATPAAVIMIPNGSFQFMFIQ